MKEKKDYSELYKEADILYAEEVRKLMEEMNTDAIDIPLNALDIKKVVMNDGCVFPKIITSSDATLRFSDIIGVGEQIYEIVYEMYRSQYKETPLDKLRKMDFNGLIEYMMINGVLTDNMHLFEMENNDRWRIFTDEYSFCRIMVQIIDQYNHDDFRISDRYCLIDEYDGKPYIYSFNTVEEIVDFFAERISEVTGEKTDEEE